jgi:hypothetical protein
VAAISPAAAAPRARNRVQVFRERVMTHPFVVQLRHPRAAP